MNEPTDLSDDRGLGRRVAHHLDAQATGIVLTDTSVGTVIRRARRRRNRRRGTIGAVSVAALASGTVGAIHVLSKPSKERTITVTGVPDDGSGPPDATPVATPDPSPAAVGGASPAVLAPSALVWNAVEPDSAEALVNIAFGPSGSAPYIAVASAPGLSDPATYVPTLYRSDDGINWSRLAGATDVPLSTFDSYGGAMYAFSTAALTAAIPAGGAGDVVVAASTDDGGTWSSEQLPLDLRALADERGVAAVPFDSPSIAAGPRGVLAVARLSVQLDLAELRFPAGTYAEQIGRDGVVLRDDPCALSVATTVVPDGGDGTVPAVSLGGTNAVGSGCAVSPAQGTDPPDTVSAESSFHSWSDLGLAQPVIDALTSPVHAYLKAPGASAFTEIAIPALGGDDGTIASATAYAFDDAFVLLVGAAHDGGTNTTHVLRSTDGVTWSDTPVPLPDVERIGRLADGALVAYGYIDTGDGTGTAAPGVAVTHDWTNWRVTDLSSVVTDDDGSSAQLMVDGRTTAIGASGITVTGAIVVDPFVENGPVTMTRDGVTASMVNANGDIVFTDAETGEELGRAMSDESDDANVERRVGPNDNGLIDLLDADGSIRFTLDLNADLAQLTKSKSGMNPRATLILHSEDGVTWSREDVTDIAGFAVTSVNHVQSSGTQVLVTVTDPSRPNQDGRPTTVVLVGTPKG